MAKKIKGMVATIADNGSLVTDIRESDLADAPRDESVSVKFAGHETIGIYPAAHDQPPSTMVALLGASGFIEIEIVGIPIAEMLGIKAGEEVEISW